MRPWVVLVFAASLLLSCESQGPSAVTPVFVQKGGDVLLNVDADVTEDYILVNWNVNQTIILAVFRPGRKPSPYRRYIGRVEFPEKKYSMKLKNLQEADTGVYTAQLLLDSDDRTLAQYNVIVQDPVSPVELSVISVDSRSSECDFTVTCRTQDSHINSTFRCDNQTCSQEGGERSEVTTSGASLKVYLLNGSIICTHSNQVSGTEDIDIIEHVCLQPDGPSAVTPVFVQKGGDVLLNVDVPANFYLVDWIVNGTTLLAMFYHTIPRQPYVNHAYTERIEFLEKKCSMKLKNLKEADTGVYTAKMLTAYKQRTLTQYNVIVQDPVSPVELSVISVDYRSSECDFTVTCRTQDSHINSTFRCDNQTCSQEGGEQSEVTTSGASLKVYLSNGSIICTHNNQVSGTEDIEIIGHVCLQPDDPKQHARKVTVTAIAVPVIFVIAVLLGLFYYRKRINYNGESIENALYEIPQIGTTAQRLDDANMPRVMTLRESLYALVRGSAESLNTYLKRINYNGESNQNALYEIPQIGTTAQLLDDANMPRVMTMPEPVCSEEPARSLNN